jgi:hypothetical protein
MSSSPLTLMCCRVRSVSVEEKSYLRTALLGCLVVAAVVLTVNTSSQGAKVRLFPARMASLLLEESAAPNNQE